jgi:hypothetical protein
MSMFIYKVYKTPGKVQGMKMYQFLALGLCKCQKVFFISHKAVTDKIATP